MFKKMFGDKKEKEKEKEKEKDRKEKKEKDKKLARSSTVAAPERASAEVKKSKSKNNGDGSSKSSKEGSAKASKPKSSKPKQQRKGSVKRKKVKMEVKVDLGKPIEYPCVPEIILEYHKHKPFLKPNEEWLIVELAEFECLVDNLEIVQIIAKHSKFFELDPPELWEEFFEFVDEVPSYDEVINYDVWQEFRDKRYPC